MKSIFKMKNSPMHLFYYGLFLSIPLSILSSYIFLILTEKQRDPILIIGTKTTLVDQSMLEFKPFKILDNLGNTFKEDVHILPFYFFNRGDVSVKRENVLKPLKIKFSENIRILDYRILKTSRDLCQININVLDKVNIGIDFGILEKNDGFTGQIIYAGSPDVNATLDGVVEGVSLINIENAERKRGFWLVARTIFSLLLLSNLIILVLGRSKGKPNQKLPLRIEYLRKEFTLILFESNYPIEKSYITFTNAHLMVIINTIVCLFTVIAFTLFVNFDALLFVRQIDIPNSIIPM